MTNESEIQFREQVYRLMVSQLFYDGYQAVAVALSNLLQMHPPCPPSNRLLNVLRLGMQHEEIEKETNRQLRVDQLSGESGSSGLDFESESDGVKLEMGDASQYDTCYVTSHKAPCRAAQFDPLGSVVATGSVDASIKILDVDRMLAKGAHELGLLSMESAQQAVENHPVIRTLYDHADEITTLDFHPYETILASGSRDFTIKFFEYAKPSTKKAFKSIQEAEYLRCIHFHPGGDWLLAATNHPTLRMYKVETSQCFVCSNPSEQHKAPVTAAKWSPNARLFASASKDGSIKLWDSVSNRCINTFEGAHGGQEVCSVEFTKNSKYLLTSGKDSIVRLWELSTARCLIAYTGAGSAGKQDKRTQAIFNHNEDYIFYPDEKTTTLCCWDSRNAERQKLLSLGHNGVIKCIVHSPVTPQFVTCSDDFRARFWCRRSMLMNTQ